jgi:cobalamin biosynthesis protein CobT
MLASIRVDAGRPTDIMHHMSRLNYVKVYTVEHNVPVYDAKVVHKEYLAALKKQFNRAWHESDNDEEDDDDSEDDEEDDGNSSDEDEDDDEKSTKKNKETERRHSERRVSS